jgi:hypothetical protein
MLILLLVILTIALAMIIQIIIWRIKKPKNEYLAILIIFNIIFFITIFLTIYLDWELLIFDWLHIIIIYYSLVFAYLIAYTSIEGDSPSIIIAIEVYNSKKKGVTVEDLEKKITNKRFINPRIRALLDNNIVFEDNKKIFMSKKGHFSLILMKIIHFYLGGKTNTS